jgi:nicotinamide-nucleotide amidase
VDINLYALAQELGVLLQAKGLKLAVAESCTGGGLCDAITNVSGCSEWFDCGFITYSNESKVKLLAVDLKAIQKHGPVSGAVAREMALGALKNSQSDIAVSITGIAGPEGDESDTPVGTVWFGLAIRDGQYLDHRAFFEGGRNHVRLSANAFALGWLIQNVNQHAFI